VWAANLIIRSLKGKDPLEMVVLDRLLGLIKYMLRELNRGNLIQKMNSVGIIMLFVFFLGAFGMFLIEHYRKSVFSEKLLITTILSFAAVFPTMFICEKFTRPRY
jgi:hypothetical protein